MLSNVEVSKRGIIRTYSGKHLKDMGEISGVVEHDCQPKKELPLVVNEGQGLSDMLFGISSELAA